MNQEQLLTKFGQYLAQNEEPVHDTEATAAPDLFSLYTALTVLQSEVKGEARLFKGALDDFRAVFQSQQQQQTHLQDSLAQARQELQTQPSHLLKPLLLEWLELRDSLIASIQHLQRIQPQGFKARIFKSRTKLLSLILEGQTLTLRKLDYRLAQYQVTPIEALEQPFDPEKMVALSVVCNPDRANGIVVEELSKGFYRGGKVLRLAGVSINKF